MSVTTDDALAVVGSIGPDGGQLSTTAADGTTYTLDIPPEALLFAEDISMTPIVEIDGLLGDSAPEHIVGVRLEPDGLELYLPATLRITPASPLPEAGVATIGFHGDGDDAGLVLFDQGAAEIAVSIEHFSGSASFWPLDEEWWRRLQRLRQQQDADRLRNDIAAVLGVERQKQMLGFGDPDLSELLKGIAARADLDLFGPLRRNAATGCREASEAVEAYVVWQRQLELLGVSLKNLTPEEYNRTTDKQRELDAEMRRDPPPELLTLKRNLCFEEQFQRCRETGDIEGLAGFFLGHFRQHELLGMDVAGDDIALAHLYLERCGLWDLTIESIEDVRTDLGNRVFIHQTRTYHIRWHPGDGPAYGLYGTHAVGDGATEIVAVTASEFHCEHVIRTYNGTDPLDMAEIKRLIFDQRENDQPVPRKVVLELTFGNQSWTTLEQGCGEGGDFTYESTTLMDSGGYLTIVLYGHEALKKREWRFDSGPFGNGPFSAKMTITDSFTDTRPLPPVYPSVEVIITLEHTPST